MAALNSNNDDDVIAGINVTPFVDIALVLLVIFMATSSYIARASIPVNLPQAASAGQAVESTLNVVVTREGQVFVDGQPTPLDTLPAIIRRSVEQSPGTQAVIAADKGVPYGTVVGVLDVVKQQGVKAFALNVERGTL